MHAVSLRRASLVLSGCVLAFAATSCNAPLHPRGAGNDGLVAYTLAAVNPREVVVPPIENATGRGDLPLAALRKLFHSGMIERRYTALAESFVDKNSGAVEAGYRPGALGEQATLRVVITGWNTERWTSHSMLVVDADVHLLDAVDPDVSRALWGGHVTRNVDLSLQRDSFANAAMKEQRAIENFVAGVLASLPERNPEAPTSARQ